MSFMNKIDFGLRVLDRIRCPRDAMLFANPVFQSYQSVVDWKVGWGSHDSMSAQHFFFTSCNSIPPRTLKEDTRALLSALMSRTSAGLHQALGPSR